MFDKSDNVNAYAAAAMPSAGASANGNGKPVLDQEAAWKSDFRRTLDEIRDKGFGSYTEELRAKKLEELREKILASMGLSEDDLENMSPEQRNNIEKMVALEIQKRLAAEVALEEGNTAHLSSPDALADQVRSAPNNLGTGLLLMQQLDTETETAPKKEEQTG
ncbi:MAG: hypothetical protein RH946_05750 [Rhodospirillales bacterium]